MKAQLEIAAAVANGGSGSLDQTMHPSHDTGRHEFAKTPAYTPYDVAKIILISVAVYATILSFPAVLGGLARAFHLTDRQIGWIGSAELLGVTCGTLIIAHQRGQRAKHWLFGAAAFVGIGNLLAAHAGGFSTLLFAMWLVGIGAGLGGGFAYKAAGQSANPDRVIALVHVFQLLGGMTGYQILKVALPAYGITNVLQGYAALSLVVVLAAMTLVIKGSDAAPQTSKGWSLPPRPAMLVLLGFWFFCCGEVGLYAFLERIGVARGFAVSDLSNVFSGFALAGIAGSLMVAVIPAKWPRAVILAMALIVGQLAVFGVFNADTIGQYAASCAAFAVFIVVTIPTVLGVVSRLDPTGRSTALGLTVASTGQAIGPGVAGMMIIGTNYTPVGWFAATCYSLAILGVLAFMWRAAAAKRASP